MAVTVDRRLFLTADGELVEDGDPRGTFLWAGEGTDVDEDEAKRVGYKPAGKQKAPAEDKQVDKPADKEAGKPADKAVKKPARRTRKAT